MLPQYNTGGASNNNPVDEEIPVDLQVGDEWGGGLVVYIDPARQNATIMAKRDFLSPPLPFDSNGTRFSYLSPGTQYSSDYYGGDNTQALVNQVLSPESDAKNEAAMYCSDIVIDGYDDWYLPAWKELQTVDEKVFKDNIYFNDLELWSSACSGDTAIVFDYYDNPSNQLIVTTAYKEKELHFGKKRALPFRKVGKIY